MFVITNGLLVIIGGANYQTIITLPEYQHKCTSLQRESGIITMSCYYSVTILWHWTQAKNNPSLPVGNRWLL